MKKISQRSAKNLRRIKILEKKFSSSRSDQLELEVQSQKTLEYIVKEIQQLKKSFIDLSEAVSNELEKKNEEISKLKEENLTMKKKTRRELMNLKYRYTTRLKNDNEENVKGLVRKEIKGMFIDAKHEIKKELTRNLDQSVQWEITKSMNLGNSDDRSMSSKYIMQKIREIQLNLNQKTSEISKIRKHMNKVIAYIKRKLEPKITDIDLNQSNLEADIKNKTLLGIINN